MNTSWRFALGASNVCLFDETRHAPSVHFRDARVYGHTTTAAHDYRTHTPLPAPQQQAPHETVSRAKISSSHKIVPGGTLVVWRQSLPYSVSVER